jgi:hypothetical protein
MHSVFALVQFPQGVPLVKTSHLTFLLRQGMHALGALRLIISVDKFLVSYASPDNFKHHLPTKTFVILLDASNGNGLYRARFSKCQAKEARPNP